MSHAILSPHLDDAVLSCWHVLEGGAEVTVVNVFTASPPSGTPPSWWDSATGATDSVERMRERREEDAAALALVARSSLELGLLDDQYREAALSVHDVVERIRLDVEPGAILHAPGAFDGHPDHVLVRDAALQMGRLGRTVVLYADLPHAILRGWPAWLSGDHGASGPEVATEWSSVLAAVGLPAQDLGRRVHALDAQARSRKLHAIGAYGTQRAALDRMAFVPLEDPCALAWEVSWDIRPSALRGADEQIGEATIADSPGEPLDDPV